jgi:hypothetical protein
MALSASPGGHRRAVPLGQSGSDAKYVGRNLFRRLERLDTPLADQSATDDMLRWMPQNQDRQKRTLRCPKCGSGDVRRTERLGLIAWLFQIIGRAPFLCRSCHRRFFRRD